MIRRSIAGLILGPSLLLGSLAWTGYLALRSVFEPDRSRQIAEELLDNDDVRAQLSANLGAAIERAVPEEVPITDEQVDTAAARVLEDPQVEALVIDAFTSAHGAFLGEGEAPRTLNLGTVSSSARTALVEAVPALEGSIPESPELQVTLPTDRIPDASPVKDFLERVVPILAVAAVGGALLALLTTSDRSSVLGRAGVWAFSTTAFYLLIGLGLPWLLRQIAPAQAEVFAALIAALLRSTLLPSIVLAGCGVVLVVAALAWPDSRQRPRAEQPEPVYAPAPRRPAAPAPRPVAPTPVDPTGDYRAAARRHRPPPISYPDTPPRGTGLPPPPASPPTVVAGPTPAPDPASPPVAPPRPVVSRPVPPEPPVTNRPPPLPTAASTSARTGSDADATGGGEDDPTPGGDSGSGSGSKLPTKEQGERRSKWLPPRWVEGHGWVLDPDDPEPPPPNAQWVEGVGHVVPGPPP